MVESTPCGVTLPGPNPSSAIYCDFKQVVAKYLPSAHSVPGVVLSALHILTCLLVTTALWSKQYYLHRTGNMLEVSAQVPSDEWEPGFEPRHYLLWFPHLLHVNKINFLG